MSSVSSTFDAVVVGCGPAGLSAAIGLVKCGFKVCILEKKKAWDGRVCGSFLSPESARHLDWLGILDQIRQESALISRAQVFQGRRDGVDFPIGRDGYSGMGVSRETLEYRLRETALERGIFIHWGIEAREIVSLDGGRKRVLCDDPAQGAGREFDCSFVILADGKYSSLRTPAGRGAPREKAERRGWLGWSADFARFKLGFPLSLHFFPKGYFGTIAYTNGTAHVCGLVHSSLKKNASASWENFIDEILGSQPSLKSALSEAERITPWKGTPALPFGRYYAENSGEILAGDSAMVSDPFFGEGIARALSSGPLLYQVFNGKEKNAEGVAAAKIDYWRLWNGYCGSRFEAARLLRGIIKNGWTLGAALRAIQTFPALKSGILRRAHSFPRG